MPYSKFTMKRLKKEFNLQEKKDTIFKDEKVELSDWLKTALNIVSDLPLHTEKSRSELLVTPVLLEMKRKSKNFIYFSGENLDIDIDRDLNGECDFILTKDVDSTFISSPIFAIVEAKKSDIDLGLAQCIAQMIGAYIFNEQEDNSIKTIFGAVTTGEIWQFMKLEYLNENYIVTIEKRKYYIDSVESILGVLQQIIDFYK